MASLATSPLDTTKLPEDKQRLGELYNILAYGVVTTQTCVFMFSTYLLMMLHAHGHSPEVVYRALAYSGYLIGACQLGVYLPLLFWLLMMIISAHLTFDN